MALHLESLADVNALSSILDALLRVTERVWQAGNEKAGKLTLALQEALANAVLHGCGGDKRKTIHCWIAADEKEGVQVVVRDPGEGFDVDHEPTPLTRAGKKMDHGRGIFLMRQLMDAVHFEGRGNEVHLRLK